MIEDKFIKLLHIAVGKSEPRLDNVLANEEWDAIYAIAKKQALIGVINDVVERLPEEQKPYRRVKIQFAIAAERIAARNALMNDCAASLTSDLTSLGFNSCLLKGQGVAMLYPRPETRQSGDIDMWVDACHKDIVPVLRSRWNVHEVYYHHAEMKGFGGKVQIEIHFRPTWMNNPINNRRLQRYFKDGAAAQFANFYLDKGFSKPLPGFDCVFSMVHIYRHLLSEGIGMRQCMDYFYILSHCSSEDRRGAYETLCSLGMDKFIPALMYVLKVLFDADDRILLCAPDPVYGKFLLDEIFKSGNFGRYDDRNTYSKAKSLPVRFCLRMKHLSRFTGLAFSEVAWAPVFKTWQLLWRFKNKY